MRKELEIEFAQEIEKIKKELQIQNRAVLEANQHVTSLFSFWVSYINLLDLGGQKSKVGIEENGS